jgi:predicted histidine transporter YuiF (NhaC family)
MAMIDETHASWMRRAGLFGARRALSRVLLTAMSVALPTTTVAARNVKKIVGVMKKSVRRPNHEWNACHSKE